MYLKSFGFGFGFCVLLSMNSVAQDKSYKVLPDKTVTSSYCDNLDLGSYFYCEEPVVEEVEELEPEPIVPASPPTDKRLEEFKEYREEFERLTEIAVWEPTKENVYNYLSYQVNMLDRVQEFSDQFERVVWQNPELNYSVEQPVNAKGVQHYRAETASAHKRNLQKVKDRYGFYYFYAGSCAACDIFTPIMKTFTEFHKVSVLAVSMDNAPNYYFEDWQSNNGIAERLGLEKTITPAVIMLDTHTGETIPVSFGVVTVSDLERRIFKLTDGQRQQYTREF